MPSFGTIGDGYDNAMMESFWSSMQIELLNRKKWRTRLDLANAIFDYIEIFYNRQRRQWQIDYVLPIECELRFEKLIRSRLIFTSRRVTKLGAGQDVNQCGGSPLRPVTPHLIGGNEMRGDDLCNCCTRPT